MSNTSIARETPTVLLVCGPPCAGKSTVANALRNTLVWPLLSKDAFKEALFERLGWSDRAWSKKLSVASYALMFDVARELAFAGQSLILEGNFRWTQTEQHFASLAAVRPVRFVQVFCTAHVDALIERWRMRAAAAQRHPGHLDRETAAEIENELRSSPPAPLPIGTPILRVDSTGKSAADVEEVVARVRAAALDGRTP